MKDDQKHVTVRLPESLYKKLNINVEKDSHMTRSELIRDALRRYLENNERE